MRVHIVQRGDTLWKIAKEYKVSFDDLKRLNAHLANPDYIVPGMEIFLPDSEHGEIHGKKESSNKAGVVPNKQHMVPPKAEVVPPKAVEKYEWKPAPEMPVAPPKKMPEMPLKAPQHMPEMPLKAPQHMPQIQLVAPPQFPPIQLIAPQQFPGTQMMPPMQMPGMQMMPPQQMPGMQMYPPQQMPAVPMPPQQMPEMECGEDQEMEMPPMMPQPYQPMHGHYMPMPCQPMQPMPMCSCGSMPDMHYMHQGCGCGHGMPPQWMQPQWMPPMQGQVPMPLPEWMPQPMPYDHYGQSYMPSEEMGMQQYQEESQTEDFSGGNEQFQGYEDDDSYNVDYGAQQMPMPMQQMPMPSMPFQPCPTCSQFHQFPYYVPCPPTHW